jgi:hypothetical protein
MRSQKAKKTRNWLFAALRVAAGWAGALVADRPASKKPPPGNWIPNSDGEGGKVISSGNPGGH